MNAFVALEPESQLGYQLVRVADRVSRSWHAALRSQAINPRQFSILALLAHNPGLSQAELARRVLVTPQSMSESLSNLIDSGLIARDETVRGQAARVQLTAKGRRLLARAYPIVERSNRESFSVLTRSERAELARVLAKLLERLQIAPSRTPRGRTPHRSPAKIS